MKFSRPRGTRDFLPDDMEKRRNVENIMRSTFESFGYREILTPTFETLELITAKSGEEIIKSLFDFTDKSGRRLALRPEITAPVMRVYIEKLSKKPKPIKLYYIANCFRYERPQSGEVSRILASRSRDYREQICRGGGGNSSIGRYHSKETWIEGV